MVEMVRAMGASVVRLLPEFRGIGRASGMFNKAMLMLGAAPIVEAPMQDGTRMRVDLRTRTEFIAYYTGKYDADLLKIIFALVDTDAVFLDVGANIGFYSVAVGNFIRRNGGSGRLIGFEPFEGNYERNLENLRGNNLLEVCSLMKVGLSNEKRTERLTLREDFKDGSNTGNASIPTSATFDAGFKTVPIELDRLDGLWPTIGGDGTIDFVKIDIEGHEDFFLEGAKATIAKHRPTMLMEVNKPYYAARNVVLNERFLPLIPPGYVMKRRSGGHWEAIGSFAECATIDNVFLVPEEKMSRSAYRLFAGDGA